MEANHGARPAVWLVVITVALLVTASLPGQAADPFPPNPDPCQTPDEVGTGCIDPYDYAAYLKLASLDELPPDYQNSGDRWKYSSEQSGNPEVDNDPRELNGVTGMSIDKAWTRSTGRPDVVIAVLDSGIEWDEDQLQTKAYLNTGELPLPEGADPGAENPYDVNFDGVVNVLDYAEDSRVSPTDGPRGDHLDAGDLIAAFSDGVDDDGNGFVDDISGWNFLDDTNDPYDEVRYGHGTGEAEDSTGEAGDAGGFPGVCPSCRFMPLRVGQSFIAHDEDYAQAVLYATDAGANLVQEALGTVDNVELAQDAHRYAWDRGVPIIASAADEAAYHHNFPSGHDYTINLNSIRTGDISNLAPRSYLYLNGCTNFGGNIYASVSSTACSSEATGRGAGVAGLLVSHAKNLADEGELSPHPAADSFPGGSPLSAAEVRQLFRTGTDDIDLSTHREVVSPIPTVRYNSQPGWDQYTGYGRLNVDTMLAQLDEGSIPPEATITGPGWWASLDALQQDRLEVSWEAGVPRASQPAMTVQVQTGCGVQPSSYRTWATTQIHGQRFASQSSQLPIDQIADACLITDRPPEDATAFQVTLRVLVHDSDGLTGVDRRTIQITRDSTLEDGWPKLLEGSGESSADVVDLDGDGVDEIVVPTASGFVHAYRADGTELDGFPIQTDPMPGLHTGQPAFTPGVLDPSAYRDSISQGATGIADLDGDGDLEIVVTSLNGNIYAFNHEGEPLDGFPVHVEDRYSQPSIRDEHNTLIGGFEAAPTLVDLDGDGDKEILAAAMDRHVYAFHHDGSELAGFPVHLADPAMVDVDPVTHKVTPKPGVDAYRGAQIVSTTAVGDIDGDGEPEIVVGANEHYDEELAISRSSITSSLIDVSGLLDAGNGRLYALEADGSLVDGWPTPVPDLAAEILPYVGEGVPGSPALADLDGDGADEIAIFATIGPVMVFQGDGTSFYGEDPEGKPIGLSMEAVGPASGAVDVPVIPALGSAAIGGLVDPASPEVIAPAAGLGRALDVVLPGEQLVSQDYVQAWDGRTGQVLPTFPRPMEDLQFITNPAIINVDADPLPELLEGSGGYLLHAYKATGNDAVGFPKATNHWLIGTPAVGDIDGDGKRELVETSREGWLWVWQTEAPAEGNLDAWWSDHHDEANTGRWTPPDGPLPGSGDGGFGLASVAETNHATPAVSLALALLVLAGAGWLRRRP